MSSLSSVTAHFFPTGRTEAHDSARSALPNGCAANRLTPGGPGQQPLTEVCNGQWRQRVSRSRVPRNRSAGGSIPASTPHSANPRPGPGGVKTTAAAKVRSRRQRSGEVSLNRTCWSTRFTGADFGGPSTTGRRYPPHIGGLTSNFLGTIALVNARSFCHKFKIVLLG